MKIFIILLILLFFANSKNDKDPKEEEENSQKNHTNTLCFIRFSDLNVTEFFKEIDSLDNNNTKKEDFNATEFFKNYISLDYCDISNDDAKIKFVMSGNSMKNAKIFLRKYGGKRWRKIANYIDIFTTLNTTSTVKDYVSLIEDEDSNILMSIFKLVYNIFPLVNNTIVMKNNTPTNWFIEGNRHINILRRNGSLSWIRTSYKRFTDKYGSINENGELVLQNWKTGKSSYEKWSESIGNFFGVYNYDSKGRRGLKLIDDVVVPLAKQVLDNETFLPRLWEQIKIGANEIFDRDFWIYTNFKNSLFRVMESDDWKRLVNNIYSTFSYSRFSSKLSRFKAFFNNENVYSLSSTEYGEFNRRLLKIQQLNRLLDYAYTHNNENNFKKTNLIRYTNPKDLLYPTYNVRKRKNGLLLSRNLPDYYDNTTQPIFNPLDALTLDFWWTNPWFTGFAPGDKRKLRAIGLELPFPPFIIPSDLFAVVNWVWRWTLRSNVTLTFLPFLRGYYSDPDDSACLPRFPYVPDPEYGCAPPQYELIPPIFPPENISRLFSLDLCLPWFFPWSQIEAVFQMILTPTIGNLYLTDPVTKNIVDFIGAIPYIGIKLINNATGLPGTDALPLGIWMCMLWKLPLVILGMAIAIVIIYLVALSFYNNAKIIINESMVIETKKKNLESKSNSYITTITNKLVLKKLEEIDKKIK